MTELPRWVLTHAEKLNKLGLIRVDLRRSWKLHSWLAITFTLAGAVLAALYLVTSWPDTVTSAQIAVIASNSFLVLLSAVVLGIAAAVIVQSLDQSVYNGADIEYMLGVEPMVELPDLGELSEEETKEFLLPLAGGIIHACSDDALRRCVFTGTGHGTGVTTIAARTKETLEAIGRSAVLVVADNTATDVPDGEIGGDETEDNGTERQKGLILTDTAPLASSPDTEYLARFADCVIVVAESGKTTREQLRNTVRCLQRLNVSAVGFVLNRAKEARPRVTLRRSTDEFSIDSGEFGEAVQRALAQPQSRIESTAKRAPRTRPAASLTREKEAPKSAGQTANLKRAEQSAVWEQPGVPRWLSDALGEFETPHQGQGSGQKANVPAKRTGQEIAEEKGSNQSPDLTPEADSLEARRDRNPNESAVRSDHPAAALLRDCFKGPVRGSSDEPQARPAMSSREAPVNPSKKPSKLNGLRGIVSATHLRGLRQARRNEGASETAAQADERRPGELIDELPAGSSALVEAIHGSTVRLGDLRGLVTPENLKDLNQARRPLAAANDLIERSNGPVSSFGESRSLADEPSPAPSLADTANGAEPMTTAEPAGLPAKPIATSDRGRIAPYGEVQILPSRRGQYRKK